MSRIKPFKCENRFLIEKLCINEPIFGVLGSNSIELLWFKGGWFLLFLQLRGKWCLLIFGGFSQRVLVIKLLYIKEIDCYSIHINGYFIISWCAH